MLKLLVRGIGFALIVLVLVAVSFFLAAFYYHSKYQWTRIDVNSQRALYTGRISFSGVKKLERLYMSTTPRPQRLVIRSLGGDLHAGMNLGLFVHDNALDVEVKEICASSCANYVFSAARKKYLHRDSILVWHGGAMSDAIPSVNEMKRKIEDEIISASKITNEETLASYREFGFRYISDLIPRETEFFNKIGVQQNITVAGFGYLPSDKKPREKQYAGFYYSLEDMQEFGLVDIHLIDDDWLPSKSFFWDRYFQVDMNRMHNADSEPKVNIKDVTVQLPDIGAFK